MQGEFQQKKGMMQVLPLISTVRMIRMIVNKGLLAFLGVLIFSGALFVAMPADALTVSPPRLEIVADPGDVYEGTYLLINDENKEVTLYSSFENFQADGETGTPFFVEEETGLASWLDGPDQVTLEPGEKREVSYSITIPDEVDPGGYFSAVFWGSQPPRATGGQSVVSSKLGILMLLSIRGDVVEDGTILEFDTLSNERTFTSLPVGFFYRFQNGGGDRLKPRGDLILSGLTGKHYLNANPALGNVLPTTIRRFDVLWGDEVEEDDEQGFFDTAKYQLQNFALGPYKATLILEYGFERQRTEQSMTLWMWPWQMLVLLLVVLLVVFFVGRFVIRWYNKRVVSKAMKMQEEIRKQMEQEQATKQENTESSKEQSEQSEQSNKDN